MVLIPEMRMGSLGRTASSLSDHFLERRNFRLSYIIYKIFYSDQILAELYNIYRSMIEIVLYRLLVTISAEANALFSYVFSLYVCTYVVVLYVEEVAANFRKMIGTGSTYSLVHGVAREAIHKRIRPP